MWPSSGRRKSYFEWSDYLQGDGRISVDVTHAGVNKLVIQSIQRTDAGKYTCTAANEGGVDSQNATIIVECTSSMPTLNSQGDDDDDNYNTSVCPMGLLMKMMLWTRVCWCWRRRNWLNINMLTWRILELYAHPVRLCGCIDSIIGK